MTIPISWFCRLENRLYKHKFNCEYISGGKFEFTESEVVDMDSQEGKSDKYPVIFIPKNTAEKVFFMKRNFS